MDKTILLAAALQHWERYSGHALAARDVAAALATSTSKRLHVLSVYDYDFGRTPTSGLPAEVIARFHEEQRFRTDTLLAQKMNDYVTPLKDAGLEVVSILRLGTPRDAIVEVAREVEADLLVIGSHSKRGLLDVALGGTAQQVAKRAPCTVVLVSPKH
jgi:nucleotide-binding universal stress UspA family protein